MMEEPERILDKTGSALERSLLHEARNYSAPDDVRVHALTAVGLAASAGIGGGLLAWLSAKSLTTKLALGLSTATVLTVLPVSYFLSTRATPGTQRNRPAPAAIVIPVPAEPLASPPVETAPAPPSAPSQEKSPLASPAPARTAATSNSALRAELAALDAIRSTLANDDPAGALSFLTAYFRTFPHGRLRLEAEVLRIDALAKAGRSQAAKRHAQEFLKRHPNSVLTARVRPYAEN